MNIKDVMNTDMLTVTSEASLRDAAQQMSERNAGAALVVDPERGRQLNGRGGYRDGRLVARAGRGEDDGRRLPSPRGASWRRRRGHCLDARPRARLNKSVGGVAAGASGERPRLTGC